MTTIEQKLENISSRVNDMSKSFLGSYLILPEQLIHLNNYMVIITNNEFKIVKNGINEQHIYNYQIDTSKLRYHKEELLPSMKVKLLSLSKYNIEPNNPTTELLENVLYMRTPTTIYITYHPESKLYSVKNMNMATVFIMKKI